MLIKFSFIVCRVRESCECLVRFFFFFLTFNLIFWNKIFMPFSVLDWLFTPFINHLDTLFIYFFFTCFNLLVALGAASHLHEMNTLHLLCFYTNWLGDFFFSLYEWIETEVNSLDLSPFQKGRFFYYLKNMGTKAFIYLSH